MPRPLYLVCAESGTIDRYSNCVSLYKVLEAVQILSASDLTAAAQEGAQGVPPRPSLMMRAVATWIGDSSDIGKEFDYETCLYMPGREEPAVRASGQFKWTTKNHRLLADMFIATQGITEGTIRVTNSIRPTGTNDDWLVQTYEISVERATAEAGAH